MKIANPTYDVVFKYLMENNEIAKDIVSAILDTEIMSIDMQPQEFTEISESSGLRLFRIDFKATIRTKLGALETVLIEIQKSKKGFEIERFQSYLGLNYLKQNIILNEFGDSKKMGYPITAIYFLGFRLKNVKTPVLKVAREYLDAITKQPLNVKEDFVEKLSHDLYAIQIPRLKMHVRTDIEKILDIFNHTKYKTSDKHVLEYTGDMSNPKIARVVKHLGRAILEDDNLLHAMLIEDEIEAHFERERKAKERERIAKEEAIQAKEEAIAAKKLAIQDKKVAIQDKETAIQDKEMAIQDKETAIQDKEMAIKIAEAERKEKEFWKAQFEAMQKKNKDS